MQASDWILPGFIAAILLCGFLKKLPIFEVFLCGAKKGLDTAISVLPTIIGLVTAIHMLRASGAIDALCSLLAPLISPLGFPPEALPLALLKPVSGSASTAVLHDIFSIYGPDSFAGKVASVIAGATETTFYTMGVYFAATHVKNTRHALPCALFADCMGIILGAVFVHLLLS